MAKEKNTKSEVLKRCFLITPIGSEDSAEFKNLNALLDNVINLVLKKHGFESIVAHQIHKVGSIGDQVFSEILGSDLVLTNLTNLNANVMYETAVAHSYGKPTIMFAEKTSTKLPFDLIGDRTIFFEDSIDGAGKLISELDKKIEYILKKPDIDNPVYRVLQKNALVESLSESQGNSEIDNLTRLVLEMNKRLDFVTNKIIEPNHRSFPIANLSKNTPYGYSLFRSLDGLNIFLNNDLTSQAIEILGNCIDRYVFEHDSLPNLLSISDDTNISIERLEEMVRYSKEYKK